MMDAEQASAEGYFRLIRDCWSPLASAGRIIPFCTPVVRNPPALVIGTNHSWFDPDAATADQIAADFSQGIPHSNTFTSHKHKFAVQLRRVTQLAGIPLTDEWVGTNRCAVQTGPTGIAGLRKFGEFGVCQRQMDELLIEFISWLQPTNVLLFGRHAHQLLYRSSQRFADALSKDIKLTTGGSTRVIPLPHLSHRGSLEMIIRPLQREFIRSEPLVDSEVCTEGPNDR